MPVRHVFVYGTLRRGEQRDINGLLPAPRWIGRASVPGVMFHLGGYPGVVLGEEGGGMGRVHGEVYKISAALERQLDAIEEVWPQRSGEYVKRQLVVRLDGPEQQGATHPRCRTGGASRAVLCVVYEVAQERAQGKPVIASGDWAHRDADDPG